MKPFNLELAKAGDRILDSGRNIVFFIGVKQDGLIVIEDQYGSLFTVPSKNVFMAPKIRTVWVNLYKFRQLTGNNWHDTEELADLATDSDDLGYRIGGKAYPVEIKE